MQIRERNGSDDEIINLESIISTKVLNKKMIKAKITHGPSIRARRLLRWQEDKVEWRQKVGLPSEGTKRR
jgi:hypothetical protein